MSPLRIIGYFGIALLGLIDIIVFWLAITERNWKSLLASMGLFLLLAFFVYSLRSAARREISPDDATVQALGWYGVPFQHFFYGAMIKSFDGWLVLVSIVLCLLNIIVLFQNWSWGSFLIWVSYPFVPFVVWVKMAEPDFQFNIFSIRSIISASLLIWLLFMPAKTLWLSLNAI